MTKKRKTKPKKRTVKVGDKEYEEITEKEQKEIFASWDMEDREKQALSQELYKKITSRMSTLYPVEVGGEVLIYLKRLSDHDFNQVLQRHMTTIKAAGKSYEDMTVEERSDTEDFMTDLIAASVFLPEQLQRPEIVRELDKGLRLTLQQEVSKINGLDISQKNLDSSLGALKG